ncbi:MFS transporter [Thermoactinomyces mirandus]|uniref:MFS transporter n=1 Tax=Thermoactinomyces mirandus TaxID=2756294 RepID=A0A7W2APE0_9BACL|nr:MFS transporter [Thermoactinomyces mirandus]MBA4600859.1 MFS transporter [Thermoactinomyces mirandus]
MISSLESGKRNIRLLFFQTFFGNAYFDRAIFMLYLIDKGYSMLEVGLLQSLVNLAMFVCEIPGGMFADRYGRKNSLIIGRTLIILHFLGMIFSTNFTMFAITFILLGIGVTFISGSEEALLYDSAKHAKEEALYSRYAGRYMAIITLVLSLAMVIGGLISKFTWNWVFVASILFQLAAMLVSFFLKEISFEENSQKPHRLLFIIKDSIRLLKVNVHVRSLVIGISLYIGMFSIYYLFAQQLFKEIGYSTYIISVIFAVVSLLSALVSDKAHLLEKRYLPQGVMLTSVLLSGIIFLTVFFESKILSLTAFVLLNLIYFVFSPISNSLVNFEIPSQQRATLLSTISFLSSAVMFVLAPIMGYTSELFGTHKFISLAGIGSMVLVWLCLVHFFKNYFSKTADSFEPN